nr:MarR family transcriptional regulator [Bacteriovorax sp. HI3]
MKIQAYLHQSPIFAINSAYEGIITKINRQLKSDKLNLLQALVLTSLFFEEHNDITPSKLAEIFETSRGNMSHILSALEYQGYVKRVVNDKDARQFKIELKAEGRKKAITLIRFFDRLQELFEKEVGENTCKKIVGGINHFSKIFKESKPSKHA